MRNLRKKLEREHEILFRENERISRRLDGVSKAISRSLLDLNQINGEEPGGELLYDHMQHYYGILRVGCVRVRAARSLSSSLLVVHISSPTRFVLNSARRNWSPAVRA